MPTIKAAARRQSALGVSTVECREPRMEYNDIHSDDGQRRGSPRGVKSKREAAAVAVACHINVCFKRAGGALPPERCFLQGILMNKMLYIPNIFSLYNLVEDKVLFKQHVMSSCCDRSPVLTDMLSLKRRG